MKERKNKKVHMLLLLLLLLISLKRMEFKMENFHRPKIDMTIKNDDDQSCFVIQLIKFIDAQIIILSYCRV